MRILSRLYWWVMHRTFKRFDRIKMPTLKPGYHDKDEMMLHACFTLLVRYADVEGGLTHWTPMNDEQAAALKAYERLYWWWTRERPKDQEELEAHYSCQLEWELEKRDQENLEELVKYRRHMWT